MPIGPSSRPQEPLHIIGMALALALAAFTGGALGLVWDWLAGGDLPEDQIEAANEPLVQSENDEDESPPPTPSPTPAPTPRPSPNP